MAYIQRRTFLKRAAIAAIGSVAPASFALANSQEPTPKRRQRDWRAVVLDRDRWLVLHRPASKETARVCYYRKGRGWQRREYAALCHMLRDVKYKKTAKIDPKLIDLLFIIQAYLKTKKLPFEIHILSGYRTPEHNATLPGAATDSLHIQGKAADIFVPGLSVDDLSRLVKAIGVGGIGIYRSKKFVHVDVGDFRTWVGELQSPLPALEFDDASDIFADVADIQGLVIS